MVILYLKRLNHSYIYFVLGIHEENTLQTSLCRCLEPNHEQDSFGIFIKSMRIYSKFDSLPSISQLGVDIKWI